MDISLLATAAMAILGPYISKAGEKVAENIGEDLWNKIKSVFTKDKEIQLVKKVENREIKEDDLVEIENSLKENLNQKIDFVQVLKTSLNINSTNEFILENYLLIASKIQEELKTLYLEQVNAGIAIEGDYKVKIAQLERKLRQTNEKIISLITNK